MSTPDEIQPQADERYRRRSLFVYHVVIAALCLMMLWFSPASRSLLPEMITIVWVSLLLIQGARILIQERREHAIEREWRRYQSKPKRRLTDENEAQDRKVLQGV